MSNNLQKLSEILGLVETETNDSFVLSLKVLSEKVKALDLDNQFIKAVDTLSDKGLDSGFVLGFPDHKVDLKELVDNFSKENPNKKRSVFVASLKQNYKSYQIDDKGDKKEITPPDAQPKQYKYKGVDNFTNFYSSNYLKQVAKETDNKVEFFDSKGMINLAVIYNLPEKKEVKEVKKKKKASNK